MNIQELHDLLDAMENAGFNQRERNSERMRAIAKRLLTAPQAAEPNGLTPEWLWSEFMDYCKAQGRAPSECKRLFEIVTRARALLAKGE